MSEKHIYHSTLEWTGNSGKGTADYRAYERSYQLKVGEKPVIEGSSDPSFRGDKNKYNPEDLFISSIASCHMLWYLHLCSANGVIVEKYIDHSEGTMKINSDGGGSFTEVILRPEIEISPESSQEMAIELHHKAHDLCFIANSCNFPIKCQPKISQ